MSGFSDRHQGPAVRRTVAADGVGEAETERRNYLGAPFSWFFAGNYDLQVDELGDIN